MAVSTRTMTRQRDFSRLFIALGVLAGVVAVAPIFAAILGLVGASTGPRTAFASAPAGEYAVIGRSDGAADVISVASAASPGAVTEIARIPRLEGFPSSGAVSPDGRRLALVSADGGTRTHPLASLNVVDLESGKVTRAATNVLPGQAPVWSSDGKALFTVRLAGGNESSGPILLLRAPANGSGEGVLKEYDSVLGVYPVGENSAGDLVTIVLGGEGSILEHGDSATTLSANLTRDWRLSPDGSEIAFIEVDTSQGTRYLARSVRLDSAGVQAAALSAAVSALGTAWNPATGAAAFGFEPQTAVAGARTQAVSAAGAPAEGFDVPQGYSESGKALVVTHWDGSSFQDPGAAALTVISDGQRAAYENYTRFYGWSAR